MAKTMQVSLVAADREVWSGEAKVVNARTAGGEIGILANHMPVLSLLEAGVVEIETARGETWLAAVDDGFLSVAGNRVSILATRADLASDIDAGEVRAELDRTRGSGSDDHHTQSELRRLEARLHAAERAS